MTAAGVLVGSAVAAVAAPALRNALFGVEPADPASFALAALLMLAVATCACLIPALRATAINPSEALRVE